MLEPDELLNPPDPRPLCDIEQQAIVIMKSFCPNASTPDCMVGTILAQGFTNCWNNQVPPVLTRTGVVPGDQARLPNSGMEAFCRKNVIRRVVVEQSHEYHTVIARCRKLDLNDLIEYLKSSVLELETLIRLIQWWTKYCRVENSSRSGSRVKDAIRFQYQGQVRKLSDYLFYEKDSNLTSLPRPETVLPKDIQDSIGLSVLQSDVLQNTWFNPLPVELFAEFISHHPSMTQAQPEDEKMLADVWESTKKMEDRIVTLERILDIESPSWRQRHE